MQDQVSMAGIVENLNEDIPISAKPAKRRVVWLCPEGRWYPSYRQIVNAFH